MMPPQTQESRNEASATTPSTPSHHTNSDLITPTYDQSIYKPFPFASPPPVRIYYTSTPQNKHKHNHSPFTPSLTVSMTNAFPSSQTFVQEQRRDINSQYEIRNFNISNT